MSTTSGYLYRWTPQLYHSTEKGDWNLVWCILKIEEGLLLVYQEQNGKLLASISIKESDFKTITKEEKDCFEIRQNRNRIETYSSHEEGYDIDWWFHTLTSIKDAIEMGNVPSISNLCPQLEVPKEKRKLGKLGFATSNGKRQKPKLHSTFYRFERFAVYETSHYLYIVGSDRYNTVFRYIELDRSQENPHQLSDIFREDPKEYNFEEMEAVLIMLKENAKLSGEGPLTFVLEAHAIVGFVRFLRDYYVIFVTQIRKIGCIGGNMVYGIQATQQLAIFQPKESPSTWQRFQTWFNPSPEEEVEARYHGLFHFIDLTKDFFFSYSYNLSHSLQHNMTCGSRAFNDMFVWNHYLTYELSQNLSMASKDRFIQPLIFGAYEQCKFSIFGRLINIILLARRSRHFAGTRYLKRGVADTGKVANDVEYEQIVEDESMGKGKFSSFVQHRGSIPIFWSQETSVTIPKPPIVLNRVDPTYTATRKHFADLFRRYGSPLLVLNLVKQSEKREREVIVGTEFRNAVEYLNSFMPSHHQIRYVALDYSRISKQKDLRVLRALDEVAIWSLRQTGFFCSEPKRHLNDHGNKVDDQNANFNEHIHTENVPPSPTIPRGSGEWLEQHGVLRTNCIDCLDRTNVGQFSVGRRALGQQLYVMGIQNTPILESQSPLLRELMQLYSRVGDIISLQYGGSEAHKKVKDGREKIKHKELLTSIRRYYSNSFTDRVKQDSINLFLGHFIPGKDQIPLWDIDSDYYLHNFAVKEGTAKNVLLPNALTLRKAKRGISNETEERRNEKRRQRRRDAYERARIQSEWWLEPLRSFEKEKFIQDIRDLNSSKEKFEQIYHPNEFTCFNEALKHTYMRAVDLSFNTSEPIRTNRESSSSHMHDSGCDLSITKDPLEYERLLSFGKDIRGISDVDDHISVEPFSFSSSRSRSRYRSCRSISSMDNNSPCELYHRYVEFDQKRNLWEREGSEAIKKQFQYYLRDVSLSSDDARGLYELQLHYGATYRIAGGRYCGLGQNVKARQLVSRNLKCDREQQTFYEDSIDLERLASMDKSILPSETYDLYASYFEEDFKDENDHEKIYRTVDKLRSNMEEFVKKNNIEPVGPLFRRRGRDKEFVLYNQRAADTDFGCVMDKETELSFYHK